MFQVHLTKTAEQDLQEFDIKTQENILEKIRILGKTPFPTIKPIKKIKRSKNISLFRLRVGDHRVIYYIRQSIVFVLIIVKKKEFDKEIESLIKTLSKRMK